MPSPVVTNTSAQVNAKTLLLAETPAQVSGGLIPATDGVQIGYLLRKVTSFTDAQIKALPTTSLQIVPAPGVGFRNRLIGISYLLNITAGVYGNIDTGDVFFRISPAGAPSKTLSYGPVNSPAAVPALTMLTSFLTTAAKSVFDMSLGLSVFSVPGLPSWILNEPPILYSEIDNQPLILQASNGAAGNYTGGNAANTLKVIVYYLIESIT